jgi:hypothetical protein
MVLAFNVAALISSWMRAFILNAVKKFNFEIRFHKTLEGKGSMKKRNSYSELPPGWSQAKPPQGLFHYHGSRPSLPWVSKPRAVLFLLGFLLMIPWVFPPQAQAQTSTPTTTPTDSPTATPTDTATLTPTSTQTSTPQPAQGPVNLGSAGTYAVLAGTTVTNTGSTTLCGNLGLSPGTSVTGSPAPVLTCGGVLHVADGPAAAAQVDLIAAYNDAATRPNPVTLSSSSYDYVSGSTITPGLYYTGSTLQISGSVTLDGQGNPNSVFIFQVGSALNVDGSSALVLIGGANAANVIWQVTSTATINTAASFQGTILALTDINFLTGATFLGRALARNGQVTLQGQSGGLGTPTPAFGSSGSGQLILAPVPAHQGGQVILFFDKTPASSQWEIFNVAGERVATLSFTGPSNHFWDTSGAAPGLYFVRIQIVYADGTNIQISRKAAVIP